MGDNAFNIIYNLPVRVNLMEHSILELINNIKRFERKRTSYITYVKLGLASVATASLIYIAFELYNINNNFKLLNKIVSEGFENVSISISWK